MAVGVAGALGRAGDKRVCADGLGAAGVKAREGTVILADPDAGMDVEARVGPLEHLSGRVAPRP